MSLSEIKSFMLYLVILLSVYLIKNIVDIFLNIRIDGECKKDIIIKVFKESWTLFIYNIIILSITVVSQIMNIDIKVQIMVKKYLSYSYIFQFVFWLIIPTFMNFIIERPMYKKFINMIYLWKSGKEINFDDKKKEDKNEIS